MAQGILTRSSHLKAINMMLRFATVSLLLALITLALARKDEDWYEKKCLAVRGPSDRKLRGLPRCRGGTQESWFNFEAKIDKVRYDDCMGMLFAL